MINRLIPALAATVASYLVSKAIKQVQIKAKDVMAKNQKKSSAPKDLGTLDYDPKSQSYRPKDEANS